MLFATQPMSVWLGCAGGGWGCVFPPRCLPGDHGLSPALQRTLCYGLCTDLLHLMQIQPVPTTLIANEALTH